MVFHDISKLDAVGSYHFLNIYEAILFFIQDLYVMLDNLFIYTRNIENIDTIK